MNKFIIIIVIFFLTFSNMQKKIKILILESIENIKNEFERYFHNFYNSLNSLIYNIEIFKSSIFLSVIIDNTLKLLIEISIKKVDDKFFIIGVVSLSNGNIYLKQSRQLYSKNYIKDIKSFLNNFEFSSEIGYNDALDFICENSTIISKKNSN